MSKIIGVTVGTPLSPSFIKQMFKPMEDKVDELQQAVEDILLPPVTGDDNDQILQIVNGAWAKVAVKDSSIAAFVDDYISSALEGDY